MNGKVTRIIFAVLLVIIGAVCVGYYAKGLIQFYVVGSFQTATLVGGLGMIVVGVFLLLTFNKNAGCGHDHGEDEGCDSGHDHSDLNPIVALIIICLPLSLSLVITTHRPSIAMIDRKSAADIDPTSGDAGFAELEYQEFTIETLERSKQKNADGAFILLVRELFYSANDPNYTKVLDGLKVEVEGAVRRSPIDPDNKKVKRMYRMKRYCCAADMQPIPLKLELTDEVAGDFIYPEHTWLKVQGTVKFEVDDQGIKRAVVKVEKLEQVAPPDNEITLDGANSMLQNKM